MFLFETILDEADHCIKRDYLGLPGDPSTPLLCAEFKNMFRLSGLDCFVSCSDSALLMTFIPCVVHTLVHQLQILGIPIVFVITITKPKITLYEFPFF
jgi:hypothetical protein